VITSPTTAEFQGQLRGGATVAITASARNTATIESGGLAAGFVGVVDLKPLALVSSGSIVTATLAANARISSPLAAVTIRAESINTATARGGAVGGGFVDVEHAEPKARIENTTAAYVWGDVRGDATTVPGAKSLEIVVAGVDLATAKLSSSGGGVVRVGSGTARAEVDSDALLELGRVATPTRAAGVIVVDGTISLTANQTPGAVSATQSDGGGVVNVDTNSASVSNTPDLKLSILAGTIVTAMGSITIRTGYNVDAPAVPDPSRHFQGVDAGTDTITFTAKHGFDDGMTVTYTAGGGAVTGGLAEGLTGNVIVVDEYTIMLGSEFEGAHVEADTNVIRFGRTYSYTDGTGTHTVFAAIGHGFTENQIVVYRAAGASIPGLVDGRSYRVHVVDETGIQLYELTAPMTPIVLIMLNIDDYDDPDDPDDNAVDTINAGNSYTNGQVVVYSAPDAAATFQSGYVDLQVDGDGNLVRSGSSFVSENNDTIYLAGHGFATGTEVVYSSGTAAPIAGLVNGAHYWVIRIDANRIRLADSYCHAVGAAGGAACIVGYNDWDEIVGYNDWDENVGTEDDPIIVHHHDPIIVHHHDPIYETVTALPIGASGSNDVVHKLFRMNQRPIDGLVDGAQYYVVNADGDSFQLASSSGGSPIDISVAGRGIFDLIGSFVSGPTDLGTGTGTGRIVLDLGAFGSTAEKLTPVGASEAVPAGSYTTSATVRSSGGGLVSVGKARTDSYVDADIDIVFGAGARVTSGADDAITDTGSFTITTDAYGDSQSIATNGGGGLVSVGNARANAVVYVDTVVTIGDGAVLTSGWDLLLRPVTRGRVAAQSASSQGGLGAGVTAEANGVVDLATVIDIDGSLIAEHLLTIAGYTQPNGSIDARANGSGLGVDTSGNDCSPQENCRLFVRGDTSIDIAGATTVLQADELTVRARMGTDAADNGGRLSSYAYSKAKALGADSDTTSRIDIQGGATITVHTGVRLTGWESILLAAENSGLYATSTSDANCSCGGGDTDSTSVINSDLTSSVTAEQHVLVQTWYLEVQSTYWDGGRDVHAPADEALLDDGSQSATAPQTGNHPISWNADVVLHAADPQFVIDANGKIPRCTTSRRGTRPVARSTRSATTSTRARCTSTRSTTSAARSRTSASTATRWSATATSRARWAPSSCSPPSTSCTSTTGRTARSSCRASTS
jgi:hypothetical protein